MKFCRKCGKQINADAAFCRFCGFRFDAPAQPEPLQQAQQNASKKKSLREQMKENYEAGKAKGQAFAARNQGKQQTAPAPNPAQPIQAAQQPMQAVQNAAPATKFCRYCGKKIAADATFCRHCGKKLTVQGDTAQKAAGVAAAVAAAMPQIPEQLLARLGGTPAAMASAAAGEVTCVSFGKAGGLGAASDLNAAAANVNAAVSKVRARAETILSPIQTLLGGVKSFLGGIPAALRNPKALIPTVLLALAWIVLPMLKDANDPAVSLLSWLTFAEGGVEREGFGILGGIAGKGVVAVVLASLFSGGIKSAAGGFGKLFSRGEKGNVLLTALGAVIGLVLYLAYAGIEAGPGSTMAGIAGALASIQALGSRQGFTYSLAESLTAKKLNGARVAQTGKIKSLLGGVALGFALFTALSALDL